MTDTINPMTPESLRRHVDACVTRADEYAAQDSAVWISRLCKEHLDTLVQRAIVRQQEGIDQPLLGLTFAVKDNIDLAYVPTTAACPKFAYTPQNSAFVVQRLIDAGAIPIGKTNLDQFATGLVGTRSPHGACKNTFDPMYISGGSSSGSAVATAAGLVDFALGTDTAGSGRVPAAFNNLVGVKPSCGLLSTRGVVPACRSLDCVSIFAKSCELAKRVLHVAQGADGEDPYSRVYATHPASADHHSTFVFGVPDEKDLQFFGNNGMRRLYDDAVLQAEALGGTKVTFDLEPFLQVAELLYDGPWVAERLAAIGPFYREHPTDVLPVIETIIAGAGRFNAVDAFNGQYRLRALKRSIEPVWKSLDVLLLPTTGTIYTIDEVNADPLALNKNLGYYTNFVNLLDLCALAIPAGFLPNGLPGGVTLIAAAGQDDMLLALGERFEE